MRQHAIPQNILDIEFKLFTKFTVREFVYMAIGIGFGGIFLYFYSLAQVPGIIAFPIFFFSSGLGLFLGLVNINDQKADVFLKNYIWAITHPTQRVWRNKIIDEKIGKEVKPEFNVTQGSMNRNQQADPDAEIIGATLDDQKPEFIEKSKIDEFEKEEKEYLDKISKLAQGVTPSPIAATSSVTPPVTPLTSVQPEQQTIQNPTSSQAQTQTTTPNTTTGVTNTPVQPQPSKIRIDINNKGNYATALNKPTPYIGNLNFKIEDNLAKSLPQAILVIKDNQNRVLSALQTDNNGEAMSNRIFPIGTYNIEVQLGGYTFPQVEIIMDKQDFEPIKIKAN